MTENEAELIRSAMQYTALLRMEYELNRALRDEVKASILQQLMSAAEAVRGERYMDETEEIKAALCESSALLRSRPYWQPSVLNWRPNQ